MTGRVGEESTGKEQRYVSDKLTHFVGRRLLGDVDAQFDLLVNKIIRSGRLKCRGDDSWARGKREIDLAKKLSSNEAHVPSCVCFCDIPVRCFGVHMLKYGRCGIAFSKDFLVQQGATPVFYVAGDAAVSHQGAILEQAERNLPPELFERFKTRIRLAPETPLLRVAESFDGMYPEYHRLVQELLGEGTPLAGHQLRSLRGIVPVLDFHFFSHLVFFDHGLAEDDPKNYYMEREWRVCGNVRFEVTDIASVILPAAYVDQFRTDVPGYTGSIDAV